MVDKKKESKLNLALFGFSMAVWVWLALNAMQYICSFIFVMIVPEDMYNSNLLTSVYQVIVYALCIALMLFVPWAIYKIRTTRDELGLRGLPTWTDILLAPIMFIATMVLAAALTALMMAILPQVNWEQAQNVGYNKLYQPLEFGLAFICLVVLAPVCEEIIFRGWLYGKLRFRMSALPAILITSLLFGLVHGQLNVGVTVFAMSVGMCVSRELTGTIWSGIILHMVKNGIAFYLLYAL